MHRRILITLFLILTACAPVATEAPAVTEVTAATEAPAKPSEATEPPEEVVRPPDAIPWETAYDEIKTELCPPDAIPTDQPVFSDQTDGTIDGQAVIVQRGLYANAQNEVFRIDVIGVDGTVVGTYTQTLKVCFDYIPTGDEFENVPEEQVPPSGEIEEPFGYYPDDLIIEVYPQGFFDPSKSVDEVTSVIKETVSKPVETWEEQYKLYELLYPEAVTDFAVDFIFDPSVNNSGRHQYAEKSATKIWVDVSVSGGAGSVKAGICRGAASTIPLAGTIMTVTKGGALETDHRSDNPGTNQTYDLGVKGNASGTYRISGRWLWPGWSIGYWSSAPVGSAKNCNP